LPTRLHVRDLCGPTHMRHLNLASPCKLRQPAAHRVGGSDSRGDQHGHGDGHRRLGRARHAGGGVRRGQRGRRRRLGRLGRRRRGGGHERDRRAAPGALAPRAHMCAKRSRRRIATLASAPFHAEGQGCPPDVRFQCAAALAVHAAGLGMAGEQPLRQPLHHPPRAGRAARRVPRDPGSCRDRRRGGTGRHDRLRRPGADRRRVGRRRGRRRRGRGLCHGRRGRLGGRVSQRRPPPGRRSLAP